ncbi:citryl-CoA lyase [Aliiglaciecola sp. LCG003]|uniref:citryl-CoA lyase n=1 Tax=Aliiglaciecola sp. LCG003 TaxID=3053655 RepID=UPI002573EFD7|nr:citryl-CoA lyase [Aliiglaciecola sp. LCG003]WJG08171.1 citryl-CoA lyase [Aliiglaciecola sp. LCG003]
MRIGKQDNAYTSICTSTAENITVRGYDLCDDIIGEIDFTAYFWLLVCGKLPDENQKYFANVVLASIAEHGLVPSVVAARMTLAAAPEAFQGAVSAGLNGCGSVVLGSAEVTGRFLSEIVNEAQTDDLEKVVHKALLQLKEQSRRAPGFGHPLHSSGDPRANLILKLAKEKQVEGPYIEALYEIHKLIPSVFGKSLPINVNGAIPAVMLDVGFPLSALKGISLLARTASLVAHLEEENRNPIGFILSGKAAEHIQYNGQLKKP